MIFAKITNNDVRSYVTYSLKNRNIKRVNLLLIVNSIVFRHNIFNNYHCYVMILNHYHKVRDKSPLIDIQDFLKGHSIQFGIS